MAQETINVGSEANDRTGDTWRDAMVKANSNFDELYGSKSNIVIVINEEADFPVQDATTITLESDVAYFMGDFVETSKRFICEPRAALTSPSQAILTLRYSGVGPMFDVSAGAIFRNIQIDCPNGTVFDVATTTSVFALTDFTCLSCVNVGTIAPCISGIVTSAFPAVSGNGITYTGTGHVALISGGIITSTGAASVNIDCGTAVFATLGIENVVSSGVAGGVSLSGAASSANLASGVVALVSGCTLNGGSISALSGIDEADVRWDFRDNNGTTNSRSAADGYITTSETVTVSASGTFYQVSGTGWSSTMQDRFTTSTGGVITYNGEIDINVQVTGVLTVEKVGGGSDTIEGRIAKNWTTADTGLIQSRAQTDNVSPTSIPLLALVSLSSGDTIRSIVANQDSTADIIVDAANLVITEA